MVIVVVLPLTQLLVEQMDVITDAVLVEELVELLVIYAMRPLHLAVETRRARTNVDVRMSSVSRCQ
jgi:ACR3 family arsenite efflux pump ArsB